MTDATAGRGGVGIRLFIEGGEVVRRTFAQVGDSGKKMWAEIALGEKAANPAIRGLSAGVNEARGALDGLVGRAGPAGAALSAFGGAGVIAAAGLGGLAIALVKVREGMAFAAELTDVSDRIGVSAEALQQWSYVADEAGVSVATFQSNLEKMNGQIGAFKAGIGDGRLKPIFEELGITRDQLAKVDDAGEMMMLLADTLGQVKDRAVQVRLARGLGVEESLPILRLGSEEIARLSAEAENLGLVMRDDVRKELDEADRSLEKAQQRIDMAMRVSVAGLADDFAALVEGIAEVVQWLGRLDAAMEGFSVGDNPATRAGQWVNDKARGFLGLGRNPQVAAREAAANGIRVASIDELRDLAGPSGGFDPRGHANGGAARNAAREAEQRRQREERAADQLARLRGELGRTYDRSLMSIDDRAAYEVADLEQERAERLREIARQEEQYVRTNGLQGLTEAEAEQLRLAQTELTDRKKGIVEWERRRAVEVERLKQEEQAAEAAVTLMDLDAQLTTSRRERVALERRILLATLDIERRRKQAEVDDDNNLTDDMRRRIMGDFEASASRRVRLFDHTESERLREEFKSYGREVVQAIEDGNIGAYIGDQLKQRLLDGALDALFNMFNRGAGAAGGGWASTAVSLVGSLFGGGRAGGGGVRAGFRYDIAEHGRPELLLLGGQGQVTDAAATARMLREAMGPAGGWGGQPVIHQTLRFDNRGAVMTADLLAQMEGQAQASGEAAVSGARAAVPADRARADRYTLRRGG